MPMNNNDTINSNIIVKNGKELRCGYTTGSCATAASSAAVEMLLSGKRVDIVKITLPSGGTAMFEIENINLSQNKVSCSVIKDAGDDPDVTDGIEINAEVSLCENGFMLLGGEGVGTVASEGLQCKVGEPAINPVPRKMIEQNVNLIFEKHSYKKGVSIKISAINGEEIAKHTFNSRLGIIGGISILGTTGVVEPMSEKALVDTIKVLIDKAKVKNAKTVLIAPGNYGRDYCINKLGFDIDIGIKFSNFIGETLDYLVYNGFERVLLVGHVGKLIKLAGGIMNTHSSIADCRMELLAVHSALCGADCSVVKRIMDAKTTDQAIAIIDKIGIIDTVFSSILEKIKFHINYRIKEKMQVEVIIFSANDKMLIQTAGAQKLAEEIANKNEREI